jgi:hypothetical protein
MLKLTSLVLGLVTAISLAPAAQALPHSGYTPIVVPTVRDRPQVVVVRLTPQMRWEAVRRHRLELARERAARARWEARYPHRKYVNYRSGDEYRNNYNFYRYDR